MLKGSKEMLAYKQGLHDCWTIAKMLILEEGYTSQELVKIFGKGYTNIEYVFKNYSIEQVIKKITDFTEKELRIGDEVKQKIGSKDQNKYIVVTEENHGLINVINKDFKVFTFPRLSLIKTGYNFDIAKMLRSLNEK